MSDQIQLTLLAPDVTEAHVDDLLRLLRDQGWLTRRKLCPLTGWSERTIRAVAEQAGDRVVRGPRGYNVPESCSVDELIHAAGIAESQGKKMIAYGQALRHVAHRRVA